MRRTRWQTLLLVAVAVAVATWIVLGTLERHGVVPPEVPWLVVAVEVLISAVVFSMGWAVRQFLRGKRPSLDPIRAARTAVLAKASCYTGALLSGWYGGQLWTGLDQLEVPGAGERVAAAAIATGGAVLLAVVGLVVEGFCRVPPPSDDDTVHDPASPDPSEHPA